MRSGFALKCYRGNNKRRWDETNLVKCSLLNLGDSVAGVFKILFSLLLYQLKFPVSFSSSYTQIKSKPSCVAVEEGGCMYT